MSDSLETTESTENIEQAPPEPVDAVISVFVPANRLEASLSIEPPQNGGAAPTLAELESALSDRRIVFGVDTQKLAELAQTPVYNRNIPIARGITPVNGTDGTYTLLFAVDRELKPHERSDGTVDYHDLGIIQNVKKGQVLCKIVLPTDGTEGISVTGERLAQIKGKAVSSLLGKNAQLSEDGTEIYAAINGQIEFNGRKIVVSDTFYVSENVDNSTGNIKFSGNVSINGMVLPGFTVEAEGNIEIRDTVESATLKAGGNIILHSGMIGSTLSCQGDLTSRFLENCEIFVKGAVKAESIMNCNLHCGKNLQIVGLIAKLIGGSCVVGENIEAHSIGSNAGVVTELELGTDPSIIERQQELTKQLPALESQLHSLSSLISLLRQLEAANRLTPDKKEVLDNALFSYDTGSAELESGKQELISINDSIQTKGYGKVICPGTIYPGTRVTIGAAKMTVTDALTRTSLYLDEGVICQGNAR